MESIYIYDSIMRRKGIFIVVFLQRLSYYFASSNELDIVRYYGIKQAGLLVRFFGNLIIPILIYVMFYWK